MDETNAFAKGKFYHNNLSNVMLFFYVFVFICYAKIPRPSVSVLHHVLDRDLERRLRHDLLRCRWRYLLIHVRSTRAVCGAHTILCFR